VGDEGGVNRIAKDDLESTDVLMERSTDACVLVVERDRSGQVPARGSQVRSETVHREPDGDAIGIER
jgi:hypothetical protein